jgi:phage tail sheath protein FI
MLPVTPSTQTPPNNMPKVAAAAHLNAGLPSSTNALGSAAYQAALDALSRTSGVNLVCVPDAAGNTDVQSAVLTHCQKMKDRFALFDSGQVPPTSTADPGTSQVLQQRTALDSNDPQSGPGFGALYFPWILITDPTDATGKSTVLVPPSGHLAGLYASVDDALGVHQAPAGTTVAVAGALGLERVLSDADHGQINDANINALRIFPGQSTPLVWGARTLAPKDLLPFRYINVRRLFIFIEQSILAGIRWAVFQPNDRSLWKKLDRTIREFLTRVWRSGALFGKTADDAFYIRIDDELNPIEQQKLGILTIEIGIVPVRPAEFVVVQIAMWDGGSSVTGG